ncbi:ATP-binding protein [Streptomyces sp. NPDC000404]|uniref:ATP-binding protein n=2 Tax=Streptomyces ramulosus TaxID=47762 RepID=A0ABW1FF74_9ACTN
MFVLAVEIAGVDMAELTQLADRLFPPAPKSVSEARAFVIDELYQWGPPDRLDDILLCVSELATNAVLHSGPENHAYRVRLETGSEEVRIEVDDRGSGTPHVRTDHDDTHGRGLLLVAGIADDWGVTTHRVGKSVWATFEVGSWMPALLNVIPPP